MERRVSARTTQQHGPWLLPSSRRPTPSRNPARSVNCKNKMYNLGNEFRLLAMRYGEVCGRGCPAAQLKHGQRTLHPKMHGSVMYVIAAMPGA